MNKREKRDENGLLHRMDGPAVTYTSGPCKWFVNGICIKSAREYQNMAELTDEEMASLVLKYGGLS